MAGHNYFFHTIVPCYVKSRISIFTFLGDGDAESRGTIHSVCRSPIHKVSVRNAYIAIKTSLAIVVQCTYGGSGNESDTLRQAICHEDKCACVSGALALGFYMLSLL